MKKSFVGPLITSIIVLLVAALFVYFYISLNRMDAKITAVQTSIVDDSTKLTAIVNFFNSAANATPTK
ncbi:MAG: hypothetical protein WC467_03200 [Patescibacteria group bacterium]